MDKTASKKYKFYNPCLWGFIWAILLIAVFGGCIIMFPRFILFWDDIVLPWIWGTNQFANDNFLSGLIGIVLGFVLELLFISQLRQIIKYEAIRKALTREIDTILLGIFEEYASENDPRIKWWNNTFEVKDNKLVIKADENITDNLKKIADYNTSFNSKKTLNRWALREVVSSSEKDFIILKLNKSLSDCLHSINGFIEDFNDEYNLHPNERLNNLKKLITEYGKFFIFTNKSIYKKYKNLS